MKKLLFPISIILLLSSCLKEQKIGESNTDMITFSTVLKSDLDTRADASKPTGPTYEKKDSPADNSNVDNLLTTASLTKFRVICRYADIDKEYFKGEATKTQNKTNVENDWNIAPAKRWLHDKLNFYAFYYAAPNALAKDNYGLSVTIDNTKKEIKNFMPKQKLSEQKDLIMATNIKHDYKNGLTVPLNFKHALAQVVVKAKNMSTEYDVKVKGVRISHLKNKATLTFPTATSTSTATAQANGSGEDSKIKVEAATAESDTTTYYETFFSNEVTLDKTEQRVMGGNNNFFLIPQPLKAWENASSKHPVKDGVYISLLIQIKDKQNNIHYFPTETAIAPKNNGRPTPPVKDFAWNAVNIGGSNAFANFEAGKKYTIVLSFFENGGAGKVAPDPKTPGTSTGTDDPTNESPGIPPYDDIILGYISFMPEVEDYADGQILTIKL